MLLEPHALVVDLGYIPGQVISGGLVFTQVMLELLLETMVDTAALWAESEHGIPCGEYFDYTKSLFVVVLHFGVIAGSLMCCVYSFVRYPSVITGDSNFICGASTATNTRRGTTIPAIRFRSATQRF